MATIPKAVRLSGNPDPLAQRQHDNLADAITGIANNLNSLMTFDDQIVSFRRGLGAGSRFSLVQAAIPYSSLIVNGTYYGQVYVPGTAAGFISAGAMVPFEGSIAAMTATPYGAVATAGSLTMSCAGVDTAFTSRIIDFSAVNSGAVLVFPPGQVTFSAGAFLTMNVTTTGWAQAVGTNGLFVGLWVYC